MAYFDGAPVGFLISVSNFGNRIYGRFNPLKMQCVPSNLDFLNTVANTPQLCCVTRLMPRQLAAGYLTEYWLPQLSNHS
ncbi:MAG: hypothetical protein K2K63_15875 [Acetatifactor sp.]|nr:hypothetical protein [Acetatifactor sp.]